MDAMAAVLNALARGARHAFRVSLLVAGVLLPLATLAHAHAFLARATPSVGSTVETAPTAVQLEFTEDIEPSFSTIEIVSSDTGQKVDGKAIEHPGPRSLMIPLPLLPPGTYEVRWTVLSIDTHKTEGHFRFSVHPPRRGTT
jgi:methionine-rich copper-binding protein CopC